MNKFSEGYFHFCDSEGHRVASVHYRTMQGNTEGKYIYEFAYSTWNPKDKFDYEIAKDIAKGRNQKAPSFIHVNSFKELKRRIAEYLSANSLVPTRTREAARLYVKSLIRIPIEYCGCCEGCESKTA